MKKGFYIKLASQSIRKNGKIYFPYIITCIGMVMMFYIISFLSSSESIAQMTGGKDMQQILSFGVGVIAIFSVIFIFYSSSFVSKRRRKEFGLYNILGMGKGNIAKILVWENFIVFLVTIIFGLLSGVLFSKVAELFATKILGEKANLEFYISYEAISSTILLFIGIFILVLLNSLRQIHLSKPIELLRSDKTGERPPKAKWILAIIGLGVLAYAYYLSLTIENPMAALSKFFIAVIMVILATYILFVAGSITLCKILQKNKKYYYKTNHFVSVSSMAYRMKRNGASLASICILSTMVLVTVSSTLCLYVGKEEYFKERYPRDFLIETTSDESKYFDDVKNAVKTEIKKQNLSDKDLIDYNHLPVGAYNDNGTFKLDLSKVSNSEQYDYSKIVQLYFMTIDDYNKLNSANVKLNNGEVLIYATKTDFNENTINFDGYKSYNIKEKADKFLVNGNAIASTIPSIYVCVSDEQELKEIDKYQKQEYKEDSSKIRNYYAFDLNCDEETQFKFTKNIEQQISKLQNKDDSFPQVDISCRAKEKTHFYSLYSSLFLLGIVISLVFIFATVLIMYYKQITEGYEDADRFEIMQKVGMTKKEIKKSINSQVLTVFFAPLILAGVHIGFAFPIVAELLTAFGIMDKKLLILVTAGCFLVFALAYALIYKLTAKIYFKIVSK